MQLKYELLLDGLKMGKSTALPQENHFNLVNHLGLNLKMVFCLKKMKELH